MKVMPTPASCGFTRVAPGPVGDAGEACLATAASGEPQQLLLSLRFTSLLLTVFAGWQQPRPLHAAAKSIAPVCGAEKQSGRMA